MRKLINEETTKKLSQHKPVKSETGLHCDKCGNDYTLYTFESGYEFKDGCECAMIEKGKQERKKRKQQYVNAVFNQSSVNSELKPATVNNYEPQNDSQKYAKKSAIDFVKTFDKYNGKTLILQGPYGTGKSHLAYAITKAIKEQGYTAAFMHVPSLMDRIKATYNDGSTETTTDIINELSGIDLLVLDDVGVGNTPHTLEKLFDIVNQRVGMNNVYTTNFTNSQLTQSVEWGRINSRMKMKARRVTVKGDDYREANAW